MDNKKVKSFRPCKFYLFHLPVVFSLMLILKYSKQLKRFSFKENRMMKLFIKMVFATALNY